MNLTPLTHPLNMKQFLCDHLSLCTVRLSCSKSNGTGFFIMPGYVLTCAHVVKDAITGKHPIEVYWNSQEKAHYAYLIGFRYDHDIDLALLTVRITDPPCVYLNENLETNDNLYGYGYTISDSAVPPLTFTGTPVTFIYEGLYGGQPPFLKFKLGGAEPGMSGGPLLNLRTGYVCGVMKFSLNPKSLQGGGGIPVHTIFETFPGLQSLHLHFHYYDKRWVNIRHASMPPSVGEVKLVRGKEALMHNEYNLARQELTEARQLISEKKLPGEASQVLYYLALALLDGMPPRTQGVSTIDSVEHLMEAAMNFHNSYSYMLALAIFKDNFFKWNGFIHRLGEVSELMSRMRTIPRTSEDEDNLNLLKHCQPYLIQEYPDYLK